ncbi:MAG: hypothetical protein J5850_06160 [Clostridia bacterium]|nr:hypothetical protein [Clostridia bacterium]
MKKMFLYIISSLLLLCVVLAVLLTIMSCSSIDNYLSRKRVIDGFSDEMINTINNNFGVLIPNNAVFEGGVLTFHFREGEEAIILFRIPVDEIVSESDYVVCLRKLLSIDKETIYPVASAGDDYLPDIAYEYGGHLDYRLTFKNKDYSVINFSFVDNNCFLVRLYLWRSGIVI